MEKQANGDTSHDAERPVVIWGVSCPDHKIQANRYEFGRIFGNRFLPPNDPHHRVAGEIIDFKGRWPQQLRCMRWLCGFSDIAEYLSYADWIEDRTRCKRTNEWGVTTIVHLQIGGQKALGFSSSYFLVFDRESKFGLSGKQALKRVLMPWAIGKQCNEYIWIGFGMKAGNSHRSI